jgi:hypothetical protein
VKYRDVSQATAPLVVLELQPEAFASRWSERPKKPVRLGLRLPSEADEAYARMTADAAVKALEKSPSTDVVQEYNTMLMVALLARAMCRADDTSKPWELFPAPDEPDLMEALTAATIRYLFEQLELAKIKFGCTVAEATDDEVERVGELLTSEELRALPRPDQCLSRRLVRVLSGLLQVEV